MEGWTLTPSERAWKDEYVLQYRYFPNTESRAKLYVDKQDLADIDRLIQDFKAKHGNI